MNVHVSVGNILEQMPDGHLVFERGECVYHSASYRYVVGYPEAVSMGREATALSLLVHPSEQDQILTFFEQAVQNRKSHITYAFRGRRHDGSYRWRQDSVRLVYDERGAHIRSYVVARDVEGSSEEPVLDLRQRRVEEQAREVIHRAKNDFELVRSLLSLQAGQEQRDAASQAILEAAERITTVGRTYEILHRTGEVQAVNTSALFADLKPVLAGKAAARGIRLVIATDEDERIPVALAQAVSVIVNELVTNSIKYLQWQKHPTISLGIARIARPRAFVLRVQDNGVGYPKEVLEMEHTGFGLEIVHSLAEQHEGAVNLFNENGAVTEILLPLP